MDTSIEALMEALAVLQQATALDFLGNVEEAMEMYTAAISRLDSIVEVLPTDLTETVRRNTDEIRRKLDILRRSRWSREQSNLFPSFPTQFVPMPIPVEEYGVPSTAFSRVFWLMRLLDRSIQQGAFLTPSLYVSREVWCQEGGGASLRFVSAKTKYMSALCNAMTPLRSMTTLGDMEKTLKCLNKFIDTEKPLHSALDSEMGKIKDPNAQKKSMWNALTRKAKSWRHQESNYDLCLTWASNALEQCQLFERWYIYFTQAALGGGVSSTPSHVLAILDLLRHISTQLYSGMGVFLLHDMVVLVDRYQSKCEKSVTHLLPVEVKLESSGGGS